MNELSINQDQFLWCEKYRPQTIDDCILPESLKRHLKNLLSLGEFLTSYFQVLRVLVKPPLLKHYVMRLMLNTI